jgi:hypothetical protein
MLQMILKCTVLFVTLMFLNGPILADSIVEVGRVPDQGIQPRLINGSNGEVHLVYFKKSTGPEKSRQGSLYYRQWNTAESQWRSRVKVSSGDYSHLGPVSKASVAMDEEGRIHVVWFLPSSGAYRYARSNTERTHFEAERNPVTAHNEGLEAEASIVVRGENVTISWHAGDLSQEYKRAVYTLASTDRGKTFGKIERASDPGLGACACCSLATAFDDHGQLQIAYRSAIRDEGRHMQILTVGSSGRDNKLRTVGEWNIKSCPVSTNVLMGDWLAFETQGRIQMVNVAEIEDAAPVRESETRQKHPAIAINHDGDRLLVWGEAAGYFEGGSLQMQMFNSQGEPIQTEDHSFLNIPKFSIAATVARTDGSFLVLY